MEGIKHINKIREYCDYIEEHLQNVEKSWKVLQEACKDMNIIYDDYLYWNIDTMVKAHDVSKMSTEEFIPYQRNFFPLGGKDNSGIDSAWEHHLGHNQHHWENWTKIKEKFPNEQVCHCTCMVIDWMAMGLKFGDTAEEYYKANRGHIEIPEWAEDFINKIFLRLRNFNCSGCERLFRDTENDHKNYCMAYSSAIHSVGRVPDTLIRPEWCPLRLCKLNITMYKSIKVLIYYADKK